MWEAKGKNQESSFTLPFLTDMAGYAITLLHYFYPLSAYPENSCFGTICANKFQPDKKIDLILALYLHGGTFYCKSMFCF